MSEYANLKIAGHEIIDMRNVVEPVVMTMFWKKDKRTYRANEDGDASREITKYEYAATAEKAIRRLEIMGFNLYGAEKEFRKGIEVLLSEGKLIRREKTLFSNFQFRTWLKCAQIFLEGGKAGKDISPYLDFVLGRFPYAKEETVPEYSVRSTFLFGFSTYPIPWAERQEGLPFSDLRYVLRSLLEVCARFEEVVLDYTSLVGWTYGKKENLTQEAAKTVILVEGSSDKEILERTLPILYPDCARYYSFMDFHVSNIDGGAPALVRTIKAFISAGISNRIVAVFDNDTAAADTLRSLSKIDIPENIRAICLPLIELAEEYPTIGPQGNTQMNVNGLACSLEMYLVEEVLRDINGNLTPVQWTGFNQTLKQYQGEILNKKEILAKYHQLLTEIENNPKVTKRQDWSSMKLVFEAIFSAFN